MICWHNHKLNLSDLPPIFSYVKCDASHQPISFLLRIRLKSNLRYDIIYIKLT